jgi:hypothetical protein
MLLTQGYFGIGIVEDSVDPEGLGRVRVRIFDIHGSDKLKIPTYTLPWANVLHAANYSSHFERIKENTWVFVTTLDGQNAQEIVVLGTFPGIIPQNP